MKGYVYMTIKNEYFNKTQSPYVQALESIDPILGDYARNPDPDTKDRYTVQNVWDTYEQGNPVTIDTANLKKNAISNLDALPFRSFLEELGMPFEDDVLYTASDIASASSVEDLLANTMAVTYQFGNLDSAIFVAAPFFKKVADTSNLSETSAKFVEDVTKSVEPFDMITYPINELQDGLAMLSEYMSDVDVLMKSIVLHPLTSGLTVVFINGSNISGMSVKQVASRLQSLSTLRKNIKLAKISDIVSTPVVDQRNADASSDMGRASDELSRSERVRRSKTKHVKSIKKLTQLIKHVMNKQRTNAKTSNVTKTFKKTFNKPNRREPDNSFKPGKTQVNKYKPILHLYLDTSGSMSISQYTNGINAAIALAKELKTDIYLSSFSDTLAEPVLLDKIKHQSVALLTQRALKIPVISGGTDFENVYNAIDARAAHAIKNHRSPEYAIILSDMEYWFSSGYKVPKYARETLHLSIGTEPEDFKVDAYNAGITNIDKLIYNIS